MINENVESGYDSGRILYDKDIREPLFDFLEETYGKTGILEEKRTGSARADAVMITPKLLYGIEIKSDADTCGAYRHGKAGDDTILLYQEEFYGIQDTDGSGRYYKSE